MEEKMSSFLKYPPVFIIKKWSPENIKQDEYKNISRSNHILLQPSYSALQPETKMLFQIDAVVQWICYLKYHNFLLLGCPKITANNLQLIQNDVARGGSAWEIIILHF